MQRLDEQLIQKINDLVGEGVRNVGEMKRHLKIYVKDDLFRGKKQPERNNRRYFPKLKTIKNHMYNATIKSRLSMIDQDNVQQLADKWREQHPNDKFYYRQYKEGSVESVPNGIDSDVEEGGEDNEDIITKAKKQKERLLFIHQAEWQSRLILRYGQDLAFLDATYKTTKYSLPLFFVAVKTNVDYIIVAALVVQDETTESISEALSVLKEWNPDWQPKNFMTDLCEEEINSLESVFPGTVRRVT